MRRLLAFALSSGLVACFTGGPSWSGSSSPPTSSETSEEAPDITVRCVGEPKPARDYRDVGSCMTQGGNWAVHGVNGDSYCEGGKYECKNAVWYGTDEATAERDCVKIVGCSWTQKDGTLVKHPLLDGACTGTAVRCEDITDLDTCGSHPGCQIDDDACERRVSFERSPDDCAGIDANSYHPEIVKDYCQRTLGCRWSGP
jgi:hypothetical protein